MFDTLFCLFAILYETSKAKTGVEIINKITNNDSNTSDFPYDERTSLSEYAYDDHTSLSVYNYDNYSINFDFDNEGKLMHSNVHMMSAY